MLSKFVRLLSFLLKYVSRFINFIPTQISNPHKGTAYNYLPRYEEGKGRGSLLRDRFLTLVYNAKDDDFFSIFNFLCAQQIDI